jgi:hypothetical protein
MDYRKLKEALIYGSEGLENGTLLFSEGKHPDKWEEIKTSPLYKDMLDEVVQTGEQLLGKPIEALPFSTYKIFDQSGSRKEFERAYFQRRLRLNTFAILSKAFGEPRYLEALEDIIWAICDEYTWCLPAHLGGNSLKIIENVNQHGPTGGEIRPVVRQHRHVVDLFAAETGFALSEITCMLEDQLSELVTYRARREVRERILAPYCELNTNFHWETVTMNWASVCAAGVGAAAMYLIKDASALTPVIHRLLGAMDSFLSGFKDDGACTEGLGYWNYGFGFFVYFAALLKQRTRGLIDLLQDEKVKQVAMFQQKCYLTGNHIVSFSDSPLTFNFNMGLTHYLKQIYAEVEIPAVEHRADFHNDHCYRWAHSIRNFVWSDPAAASSPLTDAFYYLKDSEMLVSRARKDNRTVCFAAKGGHNAEPHNQNDVGNFILHIDGETVLADIGAGEYTKQYFGESRYSFLCNGSHGHSLPIVESLYQEKGADRKAKILSVDNGDERDVFVLDISRTYDSDNLTSLVRSYSFEKSGPTDLVISDRYTFKQSPSSIVERFVTLIPPKLLQPGRISLEGQSSVHLVYDADRLECKIEPVDFVNHQAVNEIVYLINLNVKIPSVEGNVQVRFESAAKGIG